MNIGCQSRDRRAVVFAVFSALLLSACGSPGGGSGGDGGISPGDRVEIIPLRQWTTDPSAVAMLFRLRKSDGTAVVMAPGPGESVFDYYSLTENGEPLSTEAIPAVEVSGSQRAYVTLLLDFSGSTRPIASDLLAAARTFVDAILSASSRTWVSIEVFDGRPAPMEVRSATPDLAELHSAIDALATYSDPMADTGSTDLYGAVIDGVRTLQEAQQRVVASNDNGLVPSGFMVVFTDGRDTAGRQTESLAASIVADARQATGTTSASTNVQTYGVALRGADFTAEARASFLTILGGQERYLYEGSIEDLGSQFQSLATVIAQEAQATHLLAYCSAARVGSRELRFDLLPSRGRTTHDVGFSFSADGFAPGCADFIQTICDGRTCGGFNCGGCDDRTETCQAATGQCVTR